MIHFMLVSIGMHTLLIQWVMYIDALIYYIGSSSMLYRGNVKLLHMKELICQKVAWYLSGPIREKFPLD